MNNVFKQCKNCKEYWDSRDEFLGDSDINLIGYQVHFEELTSGIFLFNHSCGSTLGIPVKYFSDLTNGPVFTNNKNGTEECPGYCLYTHNLKSCPVQCECAYVREIMQIIQNISESKCYRHSSNEV